MAAPSGVVVAETDALLAIATVVAAATNLDATPTASTSSPPPAFALRGAAATATLRAMGARIPLAPAEAASIAAACGVSLATEQEQDQEQQEEAGSDTVLITDALDTATTAAAAHSARRVFLLQSAPNGGGDLQLSAVAPGGGVAAVEEGCVPAAAAGGEAATLPSPATLRAVLDCKTGAEGAPLMRAIAARAGAVLCAVGRVVCASEGAAAAESALVSGTAGTLLDRLVALSMRFSVAGSTAQDDILAVIARQRRADVAAARSVCSLEDLRARLPSEAPPLMDFVARLRACQPTAVMAEIKRASPSKGDIAPGIDAGPQALIYARGGAAAVSVLTEPTWFKGTLQDMRAARDAVDVLGAERPAILRKDFLLDEYQIVEARLYGADTCLLIVAILSDVELARLLAAARELGMEPLVEVATAEEMERALAAGAHVIGINNRNLKDFTVDTATTQRVLDSARKRLGQSLLLAALSGIAGRADVQVYRAAGCHAVLVGEALMRAADPAAMITALRGLHPEQPLVKICGVMDETMAAHACAAGADMVGLVFAPESRRCLALPVACAVAAALRSMAPSGCPADVAVPSPSGTAADVAEDARAWYLTQATALRRACAWRPLVVGVFANQTTEEVLRIARAVPLDVIQLSGTEGLDAARAFSHEFLVFKAVHVGTGDSGDAIAARLREVQVDSRPHAALLDTKSSAALGGTGEAFDWDIAAAVETAGQPIFLAGGLSPTNVNEAVRRVRPFALDVSSGVETDKVKDSAKITAFVKAAKHLVL